MSLEEYLNGDDDAKWNEDDVDSEDDARILALCNHLDCHPSDLVEEGVPLYGQGYSYQHGSAEYAVLNDEEAEAAWDADLENYIDDCVLDQLPDNMQNYFDREAWKRDARHDGRGHSLSCYDGEEHEVAIGDWTFYVYRVN